MKVARPKRTVIRIAADEYVVAVVKAIKDRTEDGRELNGQCHIDPRYIELEAKEQPLAQLAVAWHEITHAINEQYGIGLTEEQIAQLDQPLASTLYDNIPFWMQMGLAQHPDRVDKLPEGERDMLGPVEEKHE